MKEIADYVYDTLVADLTLRGYTGWTAANTKVFAEFPPEDLAPPFITFDISAGGAIIDNEYVQSAQYEDQNIDINVYGNSENNRDSIAERILDIFKDLSFYTTNYRILRVTKEFDDNLTEIHETTGRIDSFRKYIRFKAMHIFKKLHSDW